MILASGCQIPATLYEQLLHRPLQNLWNSNRIYLQHAHEGRWRKYKFNPQEGVVSNDNFILGKLWNECHFLLYLARPSTSFMILRMVSS